MKRRFYPLTNKGAAGISFSGSLAVVLLLVVGLGFAFRQQLLDQIKLYNYVAPTAIVDLANQNGLQPSARKTFYVNHPLLQDKTTFTSACPNGGGEKTIILGCYHGNQNGIYLLQVSDNRLNGVTQVTAAHEILHAEYDRLSGSERKKIDAEILDYYHNGLKDQRIIDTIEGYKKSEPKDVVNEMHSIFGTEIASLPPALEKYYQQYFIDRSKVTNYAAQYQNEFSTRQATIKQDDAQLATLKQRIESGESGLTAQQSQINNRQQQLLALRRSGDGAAYNAGVPGYNAAIDAYNGQVRQVQSLVAQYNQLVAARNDIAAQISELSNALSTTAAPINQ